MNYSTQNFDPLDEEFFRRPSNIVAPELIGCKFIKKVDKNKLIWGFIVETEAYSQCEPACHGYKKKTNSNKALFGKPSNLYVYRSYGIHHCVNVVTDKENYASGVLLRAISINLCDYRIASGPGLIARFFKIDKSFDNVRLSIKNGIWIAHKDDSVNVNEVVQTCRIGISKAKFLSWRWYLSSSKSVSKKRSRQKTNYKKILSK